jgi:hypothetical protein
MFHPEAPSDGDDVAATIEGEPPNVEETAEGQIHAGSPQEDVEADVDAERDEV